MKQKSFKKNQSFKSRKFKRISLIPSIILLTTLLMNINLYECDQCQPTFTQNNHIKVHVEIVHDKNYSNKNVIKPVNFLARYTYGNKTKNGIKIAHWNAGSSLLKNKVNEIENIIGGYKPHVIGISESCFKHGSDVNDVEINEYETIFSNTIDNPQLKYSRISVYVHNDIHKKIRHDLMNDTFSSIWLELGLPRQKKILVCQAYREWQYLDQSDDSSLSIPAQLLR